ncbi:MAG: type III pantothenate kinase [Balneolales bacterium]
MNSLYLDVGNTRIKLAVCTDQEWRIIHIFDYAERDALLSMIRDNHIYYHRVLVSSVVTPVAGLLTEACPREKLFIFTNEKIPINRISYDSHSTMGVDRFLAANGAWIQCRRSCIVIDAGTACTIDYIDKNGVFQGGVIMPGLKSMEGELLRSAKALPVIERSIPDEWPPKSTQTGLQWGLFGSYLFALEAHLQRFLKMDKRAVIWLTGGDGRLMTRVITPEIRLDEFLVFKGLKSLVDEEGNGS